ncbi:MAG: ATP-binding protein [Methylohalobius sp.]
MQHGLSLKTRLNFLVAALLAAVVASGSALVIHHVRASVAEETESALQLARELVAAVRLQAPLPEAQLDRWRQMLMDLNRLRHVRLQLDPLEELKALPPAGVPAWFARLVEPAPRREEVTLPIDPQGELKVVLTAYPHDEIAEAWQETKVLLGLIGFLAGGFFLAMAIGLGWAFRPVGAILNGFLQLESGDYAFRLPGFSPPEFNRIAQAFNHLALVLEQARAQNRTLTRQLFKVEEEERRQLALELHDELGQVLSAIKVMALSIQKAHSPAQVAKAAQTIAVSVDCLFNTLRSMIQRLRPLMLDDLGLSSAIASLVSSWQEKQAEPRIRLCCDEAIDRFPKELQIHGYRIVQEALTNAFRHAQAKEVKIKLSWQNGGLKIQVADDGLGAAQAQAQGFGLKGIRERAESLNGKFEVQSAPKGGFCLTVWLPCEEEENEDPRHARR